MIESFILRCTVNAVSNVAAPKRSSTEGQVAQSVEQRIENPRVGGSIPSLATNRFNDLAPPNPRGFVVSDGRSVGRDSVRLRLHARHCGVNAPRRPS